MSFADYIRAIPDFPSPGILFRDIAPLLADPVVLRAAGAALAEPFREISVTKVVACDARGFLLAPLVSLELGVGVAMVRKAGKLPGETARIAYALEYGTAALELQRDVINSDDRVLIVDDVIATGGTLEATMRLIGEMGATVVGAAALIGLPSVADYRAHLGGVCPGARIHTLVEY